MSQKKYIIVIPVLNEEKRVESGILELEKFISSHLESEQIKIIIADGDSNDKTIKIVKKLQKKFSNLYLKETERKGKGFQVIRTFIEEESDFFIQLDIDMPVPLKYIKELMFWLEKDYDMAIGSRLKKESKIKRSLHRKIISLGYSSLVRLLFKTSIMDYQCGFKGFNAKTIKPILPIKENGYAFDTELILKGLKNGLKIKEIPVEWEEKPGSKINVLKHGFQMFFSLLKLKFR
ncbi:MAG: glycosyltransferase [bacterium]|nr:glycosyltransferase [bacterium]